MGISGWSRADWVKSSSRVLNCAGSSPATFTKKNFDMNKEQQDLAWKCLPKEMRKEIEDVFYYKATSANTIDNGFSDALEYLYGKHNLTSDTEPEEMLMVERKRVIEIYNPEYDGETLYELFGDKCLPDKELSFKVEPKFKYNLGDLVTYKSKIKKVISRELDCKGNATYVCSLINGQSPLVFNEIDLEPYPKENKESMEVTAEIVAKNIHNDIVLMEEIKDYPPYLDRPKKIVPTQEEKELNLCELLKGCEGISIYSPVFKERIIREILPDRLCDSTFICYKNGKIWENGEVIIYPSRALYEKYPLDARAAWMEWKESRKPKRWRAEKDEYYWSLTSRFKVVRCIDYYWEGNTNDYQAGNYFRTKEEAEQAAAIVKDALQKFHEKNGKA